MWKSTRLDSYIRLSSLLCGTQSPAPLLYSLREPSPLPRPPLYSRQPPPRQVLLVSLLGCLEDGGRVVEVHRQ